ncbi:hypothetical protein FE392_13265 [Xenorhabdus sp. 12]|uniref:DUF4842 domain-containing protein n=1 Tax=Xenorhabdus santafensis TaxID=2582833 RepID=A0ABU4SBZ9_9GAMM|nr:hypothetical protein [Xenorhabdus sp. 12]MDX7988290.1 hypothetical protein [Xenorhabdus sp. 12]
MNEDKKNDLRIWVGMSTLEIKLRTMADSSLIFANGMNMIAVDVFLEPTDKDGNAIKLPYDVILNNTYLLDYSSEEKLNKGIYSGGGFGWAYTNKPNDFTGVPIIKESTLKTSVVQSSDFEDNTDDNKQRITFYIYCSESEQNTIKNIAVMITAPGAVYSTAHGCEMDSHVQLKTLDKIEYKFSDAKTKKEAVNIKGDFPANVSVYQNNVYFSLNSNVIYGKCLITKLEADLPGLIGKAHQCYHSNDGHPTYFAHFLWDVGKEREVSIGESKWISLPVNFPLNIRINQHFGELCFSILTVTDYDFPKLQDKWYDAFIFTVYDQFGNKGVYGLIPNNNDDETKQEVYFAEA